MLGAAVYHVCRDAPYCGYSIHNHYVVKYIK